MNQKLLSAALVFSLVIDGILLMKLQKNRADRIKWESLVSSANSQIQDSQPLRSPTPLLLSNSSTMTVLNSPTERPKTVTNEETVPIPNIVEQQKLSEGFVRLVSQKTELDRRAAQLEQELLALATTLKVTKSELDN